MGTQYGKKYDSDVVAYIKAVESADGALLETSVRALYYNFIVGCKNDGIWNSIKASCLLGGARTLNGALVPLVGNAPTNNNFVSGDYNRKTGLLGDGTTKSLNANRDNNADPQDDKHFSVYCTTGNTRDAARVLISTTLAINVGACIINTTATVFNARISYSSNPAPVTVSGVINGLQGASRNNPLTVDIYFNNSSASQESASSTQTSSNTFIFSTPVPANYSNARISFYSLGRSLNLALLDARISKFMSDLEKLNL
jgi:hypothetical protein